MHRPEDEAISGQCSKGFQEQQIEHVATVDPVPVILRIDGGLVVDTEGLSDTSGLKLAKDGCVSSFKSDPYSHNQTNHTPRLF